MNVRKSPYFYRRAASPVHISKLIPALEQGESKLTELSKSIGMTYTSISQVMKDAHSEGLIDRKMVNNKWSFDLTKKGKALCELCKGIKMVVEDWNEDTLIFLDKLNFSQEHKEEKEDDDDVIRKSEVVR